MNHRVFPCILTLHFWWFLQCTQLPSRVSLVPAQRTVQDPVKAEKVDCKFSYGLQQIRFAKSKQTYCLFFCKSKLDLCESSANEDHKTTASKCSHLERKVYNALILIIYLNIGPPEIDIIPPFSLESSVLLWLAVCKLFHVWDSVIMLTTEVSHHRRRHRAPWAAC